MEECSLERGGTATRGMTFTACLFALGLQQQKGPQRPNNTARSPGEGGQRVGVGALELESKIALGHAMFHRGCFKHVPGLHL